MPRSAELSVGDTQDAPKVLDTYAVSYAFVLLFLVPGALAIGYLPFRTYTFSYVSLVTVPFVLGLLATFITDSREPLKTVALRSAVLIPLIVVTGVTVLFTAMLFLPVSSKFLGAEFRLASGRVAAGALVALISPLVVALGRRVRAPFDVRTAAQALALSLALLLAGAVVYVSIFEVGRLWDMAQLLRKDVVIYIVGALVWYLPALGISAGVWRGLGLV